VSGNLITINSAVENQIAVDLMNSYGATQAYIAASDELVEGEWRWYEAGLPGDKFHQGDGDGYTTSTAFEARDASNPNNNSGAAHYAKIFASNGLWDDVDGSGLQRSIIEFDADAVLDTSQDLAYSFSAETVPGAFAIDASAGVIAVADASLIDFESNPVHTLIVRTTDVDSNIHDEVITVSLRDLAETNDVPSDLSSGIELNVDGGNNAYLEASDGGAILGGLNSVTVETVFLSSQTNPDNVLFSYSTAAGASQFHVEVKDYGDMFVRVNGIAGSFTAEDYSQLLLDGEVHHFALTWDNTSGAIAIYVDGQLVESKTNFFTGETIAGGAGDGALVFGQDRDTTNGSFDSAEGFRGTYYDVRIWNQARTAAEIQLNYQHKLDVTPVEAAAVGLVANWQMDGFNGSDEVVDIVSGNNLSIANVSNEVLGWTNQSGGVSVLGSTLSYVDDGQPDGWTSQINSPNVSSLGYTDDYSINFTLDNITNFAWVVGLGNVETGSDYADPEFAIYVDHATPVDVHILHNGTIVGSYSLNYVAGDEFSIYVNGTTLEYKHNGVTFATDTIVANTDWYIDTAFYARSSGIYLNQDDYSLSNFNILAGNGLYFGGFLDSTPTADLHVSEHAQAGVVVGNVLPSASTLHNDVINDGLFTESADPGAFQSYAAASTFGGWSVESGEIELLGTALADSPLGGRSVDLNESSPGTISQAITLDAGKQYQVVFALSGNYSGGEATKDVRVSIDGHSADYSHTNTGNWSTSNPLWDHHSLVFTAQSASTVLRFQSLDAGFQGAIIADVQVIEIPPAISNVLSSDPTLTYDASTGKFYKHISTPSDFTTALAGATGSQLNGVAGQLVTINSAYENSFIQQLALDGSNSIWIGATDANNDGNWNWLEGSVESNDQFWTGGNAGTAAIGYFAPAFYQSEAAGEDYARLNTDGAWADQTAGVNHAYVIEWNANEVVSNYTFGLTDVSNNFEINVDTGEITLAATHSLDYETQQSHDVDITATNAQGMVYLETVTIEIDNGIEPTQSVPGAQTIAENATLTFSAGNAIPNAVTVSDTVTELDSRLQVFIAVNDGVLNLSQTDGLSILGGANGSSFMTLHGTESDINAALEGMTFTPDTHFTGNVTLNMTTSLGADLQGYYTFDGGNAIDQSVGLSQNGTLNGNATTIIDPERGEVLSLDGDGDYVFVNGMFSEPENITLSGWMNANSVDTSGAVVVSLGGAPALYLDAAGHLIGYYDTGVAHTILGDESLLGTGWRHVALTVNTTTQVMTVYLDGVAIDSIEAPGDIVYGPSFGTDTYIGREGLGSDIFDFDGLIDDVRVYGRALNSTEIEALANNQSQVSDTVAITVNSINDAPTFSVGDGIVIDEANGLLGPDAGQSVIKQSDGKVLISGFNNNGSDHDFIVSRYNEDGSFDTSFGTSGVVIFDLINSESFSNMAVQADGKIVLTGYVNGQVNVDVVLIRLNTDGSMDTSFGGGDGIFTYDSGSADNARDVHILSDGKIILVGNTNTDLLLMQFNSNGTLDTSFGGGDGIITTTIAGGTRAATMAVLDDGKWLVSASASTNEFYLLRYNPDGSLDTTFGGGDGIASVVVGTSSTIATSLAVADDGSVYVAGRSNSGSSVDFVIVKFDSTGVVDASFGGGVVTIDNGGVEEINDIQLQSDGKVIAVGQDANGTLRPSILRFNTDGSLDATFGSAGQLVFTQLDSKEFFAIDIADDDSFVVVGGGDDIVVAQFDHNGVLDRQFNAVNTLDGNPTFVEGGSPVLIDTDVSIFDAELSEIDDFDGATLTLVRDGGANADDSFYSSLIVAWDVGGPTFYDFNKNSQAIASVNFDTDGQMIITFTNTNGETPTQADVDEILRSITYSNSSDTPPASVLVDWTFSDGNAGSQGSGGALTATGSTLINIQAAADLQIVAPVSAAENEDTPIVFAGVNQVQVFDGISSADSPMRVSLSVANGVLNLSNLTGITVVEGADGSSAMVIDGLESDLNVALANLEFTPNANFNGADTLNITTALAADLAAHYTFDDTTANDTSAGVAYNGTFFGNATTTTDGVRGEVLTLDGTGDFVEITPDVGDTADVTLSAWVNIDELQTGDATIIDIGNVAVIRYEESTQTLAGYSHDGANWTLFDYNVDLSGAGWNHVAFTWDETNTSGALYLNGELVVPSASLLLIAPAAPVGVTRIGENPFGGRALNGMIDDARIYTRALSAEEIAALATDQAELGGSLALTVNAINDTPTFDVLSVSTLDGNPSYIKGGAAVVLDADVEIFDVELSAADNFDESTLYIGRNGGAQPEDVFSATGLLDPLTNGGNLVYNGTTVGTVSSSGGGSLILQFNSDATNALVNSVMQSIAYENTSNTPPASVDLLWTFNDVNNLGAQGAGGMQWVSGNTLVDITAVFDPGILVTTDTPATSDDQIQVNQAPVYSQSTIHSQSVATDANGNYMVIWTMGAGADQNIAARVFDAAGNPVDDEFLVNSTVSGFQGYASVATNDAGDFVVVWSGNGAGDADGIYMRLFDSAGVAQTGETLVNTTTLGIQENPSVSVAANGDFIVVWTGEGAGDTSGVFAQRFDSSGAAVGGEFAVNVTTTDDQIYSQVSMAADGSFIVVWQSQNQDSGATDGIYLRRFDSAGVALTGEVLVNTTVVGNQSLPSIDINVFGDFVVVWTDDVQSGGIYAQLYSADGTARGGEIQIADAFGLTNFPQVQIDNSGNFVVTYQDNDIDGDGWGIAVRRFDRDGNPVTAETLVNTTTSSDQQYSAITMTNDGQFVVVWTDTNAQTVESRRFATYTSENGDTASFDVVLKDPPTADVVITLSLPDITEGSLSTTTLTFTSGNWDTPQTVTVIGLDDNLSDGDVVYTVALDPATSADGNYNGLDADDVILVNLDNDPALDLDADDSQAAGVDYATSWTENGGAVAISDSDATLIDPDSTNLTSLLVTITNQLDGTSETLAANTAGTGITAIYDSGTGVLTLSGSDSVANYQQVLQTITYDNSSENPNPATRTITFVSSDGSNASPVATASVGITALDDPAVIAGDISYTGDEGDAVTGTLTATDVEGLTDGTVYTVTTTATNGTAVIDPASGVWTFTPTDINWFGTDNFTVTVTDDLGGATTQVVSITLANVDDAAVISGDISFNGDEGDTVVGTMSATDVEGLTDGTLYTVTTAATNGAAAIDPASGAWTFTPTDPNWFGTDSFTVTVTDDLGGITTQVISITLANVDDPAVIGGDVSYTGDEGDSVTGTLTATDVDGLTDGTIYTVSSAATNGAAAIDPTSGTWTFTPTDPNWFGIDSFTVTVTDDLGGTSTQIISISLANVDDPAVIGGNISYSGNEGDTVAGTLSASDVEGLTDGTIYTVTAAATNGTAAIDPASGAWTFTPTDPNWFGTDSFTVTVTDDIGGTTTQIISITLANADDPAVVGGDTSYIGDEGDSVAGTMTATDVDGLTDGTIYTVTTAATNGSAAIDPASGAWTFTPTDPNWFGSDSFIVTVTDDLGGTTTQTISISLANVDDPAVIGGDISYSGNEGDSVAGTITATDVDGLADGTIYTVSAAATNGTAVIDPASGTWTFTPTDSNWFGTDSFTVTVTDDFGGTAAQVVNITLANVDDPAVIAGDISYSGNEGDSVAGTMTATDIDGVTDGTIYTVTTAAANGSAVIDPASGAWAFTPTDPNWFGSDSFTVTVTDDLGGTSTQGINIVLANVDDSAVIAGNIDYSGNEGDVISGTILANDIDGLTDGSVYTVTAAPVNGTAAIDPASGVWTFTPSNPNWFGTDNFTVTVTDDLGGTSVQVINITLANVDDLAVINGDIASTGSEGETIIGTISATDVEGLTDGTIFTIGSAPLNGAANINALTGEWTFVPSDNNWYGADSFSVVVTDDLGGTTTQIVSVSLNNVPDPAVISGIDSGVATEDVNPIDNTLIVTGNLTVVDPDIGESSIVAESISGAYGTFFIAETGTWSYTADNSQPDIQQLDVGEMLSEIFTVSTTDGSTHTLSIDINGTEDAPVITGVMVGEVTKNQTLTYSNVLTISDIDTSDNPISFLDEASTLSDRGFGEFSLSGGVWTYTLNNNHPSIQALANNEFLNDTHTFVASDGTTQVATVTIYGSQVPSLSGAIPEMPSITEMMEELDNNITSEETEFDWLEAVVTIANPEPMSSITEAMVESSNELETLIETPPVEAIVQEVDTATQPAVSIERRSSIDMPEPIEDLLALNFVLSPVQNTTQLDQYDITISEIAAKENLRRATESMRDQMKDAAEVSRQSEKLADIALRVTGVSLSAGSLAWLLQSGSLFASALSSIPTWQGFDPLPVLAEKHNKRKWWFKKRSKSNVELDEKEAVAGRILDSVNSVDAVDKSHGREG
jgi:uncharacterized delta-60 repeat protein